MKAGGCRTLIFMTGALFWYFVVGILFIGTEAPLWHHLINAVVWFLIFVLSNVVLPGEKPDTV